MSLFRCLVVDDERTLQHVPAEWGLATEIRHVRTPVPAVALLDAERWDVVMLDYDLGGSLTAEPIADWLCQRAFEGHPVDVEVWVHSANPVGAERMVRSLTHYGYTVRRVGLGLFLP